MDAGGFLEVPKNQKAVQKMMVMAIDPGRDKCGLAVIDSDGQPLWHEVIATSTLSHQVRTLADLYRLQEVFIGNGTTSKQAQAKLREASPALTIHVVDEYRTTEEAKKLYWHLNPPTGWRRLLPTTMQVPPRPVDDLVAVILARRILLKYTKEGL